MLVRDFSKCPRCGALTQPSISYNNTPSEYWVECTKCNTYINTYIPQPHQMAVHTDPHTFVGNFGGYGTGKTTTSRQEFYKHLFITPNGNTLIGANVTSQYEQTIKRDIESDLPKAFVQDVSTQKAYTDYINGHRLMWRPFDDEGKLRSYTVSMFIIVEGSECSAEIYSQLKTRLRHEAATKQLTVDGIPQFRNTHNGQQIPIIAHSWHRGIIESNPDSGYIRTDVLMVSDEIHKHGTIRDNFYVPDEEKDSATSSHIAATEVNEFLPPDPATFIQRICKNKPSWWINRYVKGSFSYAEGLVYPHYSDVIIDSFEPDRNWKRLIAFDYGLSDPARFIFGAIDQEKGLLYIYKEISTDNKNIEELAKLYFQGISDIPSGCMLGPPLIDPKSGVKRDYNKKSLIDHFLDYGISFKPGQVQVDARIFRLNTYIESGKLRIMDCCRHLISELKDYKYPNRTLGSTKHVDKPIDKNNHSINALEWITMELPANPQNILYGIYGRYGNDLTKEPRRAEAHIPWQLSDPEEEQQEDNNLPFYY